MESGSAKSDRLRWLTVLTLLLAVILVTGCAPAPPQDNTPDDATVLTEEERLAATRAVYDSYMALNGQTPLATEEEAACRRQLFENMQQARWDIVPYEDAPDYWSTTLFFWLRDFPLDEGTELPYLLLPYGSTDGAYSEAYSGALVCQFMAHPYALLKLIATDKDWQYFCGFISYGAYPREMELHALLKELQADIVLTQAEQAAVSYMLESMADLYGQGDEGWADSSV